MFRFVPYRSYVKMAKLRLFLENLAHVERQSVFKLPNLGRVFFSFSESFEINTIKAEIQHCAYEKMVWGLLYLDQIISN